MKIKFKKYWRKTSLKKNDDAQFFLNHIIQKKPRSFLEVGVFHGVTSRNVCELLFKIHGSNFTFTGIDLFENSKKKLQQEIAPHTKFANPLKHIYYKYIIRLDPYTEKSVLKLLRKFKSNINLIKGDSNQILKKIKDKKFDYIFLDGGHKYETVKSDLENLIFSINNKGVILCDDYNLTYAPGIKKAIDEFVLKNNFQLKVYQSRFAEITA